jgi:ribosomal protein S18 acetylase RimI-like enzyme
MLGRPGEPVKLRFERITAFDHPLMKKLKQINSILFPQHYNDFFYMKLLKNELIHFYLAFVGDELIATCGFVLSDGFSIADNNFFPKDLLSSEDPVSCCYIMTLGVLSVYRRMGYGKEIWQFISNVKRIQRFYLHVQISNEMAIKFYQSLGFTVVAGPITNYYKRVSEPDALVMMREE